MLDQYWYLHGKNYQEALDKLAQTTNDSLKALIINFRYNNFLGRYADFRDGEKPVDPTISNGIDNGKRIPYMGWFWRNLDFYDGNIPIGIEGTYIAFMANNKWDSPERNLDEDEVVELMAIIDRAMRIDEEGGDVSEIHKRKIAEIEKIHPFLQNLKF